MRLRTCLVAAMLTVVTAWGAGAAARGEGRLAQVFQDNMVLQREMAVPVWGWAEAGTAVEVGFAGQKKQTQAGADGSWKVTLDPLTASREGRTLEVKLGGQAVQRKNVVVGEVWLAAGQSNMGAGGPDVATGIYPHHVSAVAAKERAEVRVLHFGTGVSLEPVGEVDTRIRGMGTWDLVAEDKAGMLEPPVHFGRVLRDGVNVPVGVITVAVGGTPQGAWMAKKTLEALPGFKGGANAYQEFLKEDEANLAKGGGFHSWEEFTRAEAEWKKTQKGPWPGAAQYLPLAHFPAALYNTRIYPLAPMALRGVIWHQGEAGQGGPYGARLVAMVKQWRELFGQDFYFVWGTMSRDTTVSPPLVPQMSYFYRSGGNVEIRKALELFGGDKRAELVELYDLGDASVHFEQKAEMGKRMAEAALTLAHGQEFIYTGPRVVETKMEGGKAVVRFAQTGKGIEYRPSIEGISGVVVQGKQGPMRWGVVKVVDGTTIEVTHPDGIEIATVAYAAAWNPHETLFSSVGLPASPFLVNAGRMNWIPEGPELVRLAAGKAAGALLNVAHVRREGYCFQVRQDKGGGGKTKVEAYIAKEWEGYEVEIGGQAVTGEESVKDGLKFVTVEVPMGGDYNAPWVIVAAKGKAAGLREIKRY